MTKRRVAAALVLSAVMVSGARPIAQSREGIAVRGSWVIDVRNPDGTVADRRAFDNAVTGGFEIILRLLSREVVVNDWGMTLGEGPNDATRQGMTLTPRVGNDYASLVLTGSMTAATSGTFRTVYSSAGLGCPANVPTCPLTGGLFTGVEFSRAALPAPLTLEPGQSVQVTFTISLSPVPHPA